MVRERGSEEKMIDLIKEILKEKGIQHYLIRETEKESAELFFLRRDLDLRRKTKVRLAEVTVYRDFEKDGTMCRGSANANVSASMTRKELEARIQNAWFAASFVPNPAYPLPKGTAQERIRTDSDLAQHSLEESAAIMTEALFANDRDANAFLNSAELFVSRKTVSIVNSEGICVSYTTDQVTGEFVAQCKEPQDVETYESFSYDNLACDDLKKKVRDTLVLTRDRARAQSAPLAGTYDIVLSGDSVRELMSYYRNRSLASSIYHGYSSFQKGASAQGDEIRGEKIDAWLVPNDPYSTEGIPMVRRPLMQGGILQTIHGDCRIASYLGMEPTGIYEKMEVACGSMSFADMKQQKGLHVVNFSDFQMDPFSGHFMGEIRLAYYNDGIKTVPVTGGSINGSLLEAQKELTFSFERQTNRRFEGPYAVLLRDIRVAGEESETNQSV